MLAPARNLRNNAAASRGGSRRRQRTADAAEHRCRRPAPALGLGGRGGRAGLRDPEPMVWIAFASARAVGASPLPAGSKSRWLAAFYPARGVLTRPFHLPGQARTLFALHSPSALP
jgi:hypothetical protein